MKGAAVGTGSGSGTGTGAGREQAEGRRGRDRIRVRGKCDLLCLGWRRLHLAGGGRPMLRTKRSPSR